MFSDSKVTDELTVAEGKLMPSPAPTQFVAERIRGAPDAFGEQSTSAASAGLGASATPETAIAAPATIGSKTILAFARLTLDALLRRFPRKVNSTGRRAIRTPHSLAARIHAQTRVAPRAPILCYEPLARTVPRAGGESSLTMRTG